eukprot:3556204-Rhodomonas_salina.1
MCIRDSSRTVTATVRRRSRFPSEWTETGRKVRGNAFRRAKMPDAVGVHAMQLQSTGARSGTTMRSVSTGPVAPYAISVLEERMADA